MALNDGGKGHCSMRGSCGMKGWSGKPLPCPYDGPAVEVSATIFDCLTKLMTTNAAGERRRALFFGLRLWG